MFQRSGKIYFYPFYLFNAGASPEKRLRSTIATLDTLVHDDVVGILAQIFRGIGFSGLLLQRLDKRA